MRFGHLFPMMLLASTGCMAGAGGPDDTAFVDAENEAGKEDTGYQTSLDALEVEMTLEADVKAGTWEVERAPLEVGQFALTWLRKNQNVFIQSLAEDYSHGTDHVEWLVNGAWTTLAASPNIDRSKLTHFRMAGVSAVVMHPGTATALASKVYTPTVPVSPGTLFADVGTKCGVADGEIDVEQDVYWYVWAPELTGCKARVQQAKLTVTKVEPRGRTTWPEYDRLTADKKIDALVIFGQVDHGALSDDDYGFTLVRNFESSLRTAGFSKTTASKGLRYKRTRAGIAETIDIFTPREFAGLGDFAHISDFDAAVSSHEIITYNGHSMLGASDFWARPTLYKDPTKYQIFFYNGCLGYEYYVNPILEGKESWDNVDLVSNVLETPFAIMVQESAGAIAKVMYGAEHHGSTSWTSILTRMNAISGDDAFYGASGVRTNKFHP
jgi:hypothetical protein